MTPADRRVRVARGVAASSVAVLVALASHLAAGGTVASPLLVVAPLVLSWLPAVAVIGRRLSLWRQAAVVLPAEAALHAVLSLAPAQVGAPAGHPMHGMVTGAAMPHHLVAAPPHTPGMWAAHTVAALLTLLAWRRGEQALRALAGLATGALATVLLLIARGVEPPPAIVLPAGLRRAVRARPQRYPPAAPRRGPPAVAA